MQQKQPSDAVIGEAVVNVHVRGLEGANQTAHELIAAIKKARSLADDLARELKSIE